MSKAYAIGTALALGLASPAFAQDHEFDQDTLELAKKVKRNAPLDRIRLTPKERSYGVRIRSGEYECFYVIYRDRGRIGFDSSDELQIIKGDLSGSLWIADRGLNDLNDDEDLFIDTHHANIKDWLEDDRADEARMVNSELVDKLLGELKWVQ